MTVSNKSERMKNNQAWPNLVVAVHFPGGTEESLQMLHLVVCPAQYLNQVLLNTDLNH
jgi:hypothetical protein